jgi:hypothetical protein
MFRNFKPTIRVLYQPYSNLFLDNNDSIPFLQINRLQQNTPSVIHKHVCILAGNIGRPFNNNYWDLISHCNKTFDLTIIILGHYELEFSSIIETIDHIETQIKKYPNVVFLHNQSLILEDKTRIIGAPLWPVSHKTNQVLGFTENVANCQFNYSLKTIRDELNECTTYEDIILITSAPAHQLEHECFKYNLTWIYGCSKKNGIKEFGTSQLISNQPFKEKYNHVLSFYLK